MDIEQTLIIIKPDCMRRNLAGTILSYFDNRELKIKQAFVSTMTSKQIAIHYKHLVNKPFYPSLEKYMMSGPSLFIILEGSNAVARVRKIVGATNPINAEHGTIRGDLGIDETQNTIHASDSVENAKIEINHWFNNDWS